MVLLLSQPCPPNGSTSQSQNITEAKENKKKKGKKKGATLTQSQDLSLVTKRIKFSPFTKWEPIWVIDYIEMFDCFQV